MATNFHLPLTILQQHLNNGMYLTEALMVPSFTRITATSRAGIASIEKMVRSYVRDLPRGELRTLMLPKSTHSYYVKVRQQPPKRDDSWQEPVDLRFSITTWEYNEELIFVRVPALELELSTTKDGKWKQVIQKEIQNQLQRLQHSANLRNLSQIQISNKYRTFKRKLDFLLPDLKSIAQQEFAKENQVEKKTTLKQVATELTPKLLDSSYEQENYLKILVDLFRQKAPQGVLLIGPSGVGKTALFRQLVKQSKEYQLDEFQFYATSGSRIVAGQTGFGMWQDRCTKLIRELAQEKSIIHLGNLAELIDVGKSEHNQLGIATFLRPAIARGEILCVAECTPEQVPMIEREDPQLMEAFIAVRLEEPDNKRSMSILSAVAAKHPQVKRAIAPPALERLERLHRRYATYSASPGRPLQFLLRLNIGDKITPIDEQEVLQQFARETGLPAVLLDPEQRLDVPRMKQWFCERVIGQQEAVDIVADLITTVKTDLMRPERPIASLIFIGPTGVGKTEMAKALAEFLYGSRDRLTRFDMSEYSDVISARRLVGTAYGVEGLLTAKVREQPFSVILFDEFEKAHESCFDFFLQMFGEARLTDAGGRLADFRNCVLILTSNLGAESFQAGAAGFRPAGDRATHAHEHFTRALERFLRPELMNRIDRVVPFGTLSPEMIRNIARREWQKVRERDGLQFRQVELSYSDEVLNRISEQGFDARYGARPLKRSMEREMLAPIAHQLNMHLPNVPLKAEIQYGDTGITTKVSINHAHQVNDAVLQNRKSFLRRMVSLRQRLQQLQKGTACQDLHNEQFQLERIETHIQKKLQKAAYSLTQQETEALSRLGKLRATIQRIELFWKDTTALEDDLRLHIHVDKQLEFELDKEVPQIEQRWRELLFELYEYSQPGNIDTATLMIFSRDQLWLQTLTEAYLLGCPAGVQVHNSALLELVTNPIDAFLQMLKTGSGLSEGVEQVWVENYLLEGKKPANLDIPVKRVEYHPQELMSKITDSTAGVMLQFGGRGTYPHYYGEVGLHNCRFLQQSGSQVAFVTVAREDLVSAIPPLGVVHQRNWIDRTIRTYDFKIYQAHDHILESRLSFANHLEKAQQQFLMLHAEQVLEGIVLQ